MSPKPVFTPLAEACASATSSAAPKPQPWFTVVAKPVEAARRVWEPADYQGKEARPANFRNVREVSAEERRKNETEQPSEETLRRAQAQREVERILVEARREADTIREEAYQKAFAEAQHAGYEKGFQEGFENGYAQASVEAQGYMLAEFDRERGFYRDDIEAFLGYIEAERQKVWTTMEAQIVQLVGDAVRHIIKVETEENKNLVLATVQNAMRRVAESASLRIRVNPADLETVRNYRDEILEMLDGIKHLEIQEDRRVGRGGVVLETESGNIDARLETQMQVLPDILGVDSSEAN